MTKLQHEPLAHFIILGALLFAGHNLWQGHIANTDSTITVSTEEMERQSLIFASENRRKPTSDDLKALLFSYVEEEALVREAERLGLGENDTIIRRRLAQKMRFLIENLDAPALPNEIELQTYFKTNIENFVRPEKREFSHIYLSPEVHGDKLELEAQTLIQKTQTTDWKSLGEPFIMKRKFGPLSLTEVSRLFGPEFANSIFQASGQNWQGPVESAFGLHLIRIDSISYRVIPKFEDIKEDVKILWQEEALRSANQKRLKTLIDKYTIDIEGAEK